MGLRKRTFNINGSLKEAEGRDFKEGGAVDQPNTEGVPVIELQVGVDVKTKVGFNIP